MPEKKRLAALALVLVLAEVAVVGTLSVRVAGASLFRRPYRMNEPYDAVAAGLSRESASRAGPSSRDSATLAGNLAVRFPHARVLHTEYPDFRPPPGPRGSASWSGTATGGGAAATPAPGPPEDVQRLAATLGVALTGSEPVGVVEAPFRFAPARVRRVYYVIFPDGAGHCR